MKTPGEKRQFNEVTFLPKDDEEKNALRSALMKFVKDREREIVSQAETGNSQDTIVRLKGNKSVEYGENGFIMRGLSKSEYEKFKNDDLVQSEIKYQASASSRASMKDIVTVLDTDKRLQTPMSRLGSLVKSAGLFLQETWANVSKYIPGTAAYAENKQVQTFSQGQTQQDNETTQLLNQEEKRASSLDQKNRGLTSRASASTVVSTSSATIPSDRTSLASVRVSEIDENKSVPVKTAPILPKKTVSQATPGQTPAAFRGSLTVSVAIGRENNQMAAVEQCLSDYVDNSHDKSKKAGTAIESYQVETKDGQSAQHYELKENTLTVEVTSELLSVKAVNPDTPACQKVAKLLFDIPPQGEKQVEVKSPHKLQKDDMVSALRGAGHTIVPSLETREQKGIESKQVKGLRG